VTVCPANTVDAYERLRAAVLRAEPVPGPDLGTVRRQGIAAWIKALRSMPRIAPDRSVPGPPPPTLSQPSPAATELTRLLAGIVVAFAESTHA
jgi:hypothetical protein